MIGVKFLKKLRIRKRFYTCIVYTKLLSFPFFLINRYNNLLYENDRIKSISQEEEFYKISFTLPFNINSI